MLKSFLAKIYAGIVYRQVYSWANNPFDAQDKVFKELIQQAKNTKFGKDHKFDQIKSYSDFRHYVPVRDYEGLKDYIELIRKGDEDILWKGTPLYFAKTSGTTSGECTRTEGDWRRSQLTAWSGGPFASGHCATTPVS